MKRWSLFFLGWIVSVSAQQLPVRWEELTVGDWDKALDRSKKTCILPLGILEKHGPHCPIGTDLIIAREWSNRAAGTEYAVVFPDFYFGQIYEARHQPGAFAPPPKLALDALDAVCVEIARNGFEKILVVNGHGGNNNLIRYFIQTQLDKPRTYAVFLHDPPADPVYDAEVNRLLKSDPSLGEHAGEWETSVMLHLRPNLIKLDRASSESGLPQHRLNLPGVYTAIWWFADYPNQYAGDASGATAALGKLITDREVGSIVRSIRTVKEDDETLKLQEKFFKKSK